MNKQLKWAAAKPHYKEDNIVSSKAREMHESGFTPTYDNETRENMNFIMSNQYMRVWVQERAKYEKDTYTLQEIIKEESKIKRRFVQRMMTYRKPCKHEFIDQLLQKNPPKEKSEAYRFMKFKPECLKKSKKGAKLPGDTNKITNLTTKPTTNATTKPTTNATTKPTDVQSKHDEDRISTESLTNENHAENGEVLVFQMPDNTANVKCHCCCS